MTTLHYRGQAYATRESFEIQDIVRGQVTLPTHMVGDFVLIRSNGMPVYNFCCVIDDFIMKITHVFRGEEHLSNTLRQLMIYDAFGWAAPHMGHLSMILDEQRKKLSKRSGAVSCGEFRAMGYLPEAVLNAIVLLGWTHPDQKEVLTMSEMISAFNPEKMHASAAIFDRKKLDWLNQQHMRRLSPDALMAQMIDRDESLGTMIPEEADWRQAAATLIQKDCVTLIDAGAQIHFLLGPWEADQEALAVMAWPSYPVVVQCWLDCLNHIDDPQLNEAVFSSMMSDIKSRTNCKGKDLFMPLRVAMMGRAHGTDLKLLVRLFSKDVL